MTTYIQYTGDNLVAVRNFIGPLTWINVRRGKHITVHTAVQEFSANLNDYIVKVDNMFTVHNPERFL